jgi:hypothetical protein
VNIGRIGNSLGLAGTSNPIRFTSPAKSASESLYFIIGHPIAATWDQFAKNAQFWDLCEERELSPDAKK